jgi:hypothetical protein
MQAVTSTEALASLEEWLRVSKQTTNHSPVIDELMNDIRDGRDLQSWARVDFERLIPFRAESPRLLHIVRSGFLFLPILLTWLALSQVIGPFALYLQNKQASANFLWFWQQNPDGAFSELWKLSHVALTDAAILAFLLVLAMRIAWWENSRAEQLEMNYAGMLATLERHFASVREN